MATLFPIAEVLPGKCERSCFGVGSQCFEDFFIGEAVAKHTVDLIPDVYGKACEVAAAVGLPGALVAVGCDLDERRHVRNFCLINLA